MMETILTMNNIIKSYPIGEEEQLILNKISFAVNKGEFISILGPSGSGKSTLMNIIGCIDTPTEGEYILNGNEVDSFDEIELSEIRNQEIGFVFQQFQLLPRLSALENVELPLIYSGVPAKERRKLAEEMLIKVGLKDKVKHHPNQLSGGQQQRVAIARALVTNPTIILADEPTGALDQKTGEQIMQLFNKLHQEGKTIVMITHDEKIAKHGSRIVKIIDGQILPYSSNEQPKTISQSVTEKTPIQSTKSLTEFLNVVSNFFNDHRNIELISTLNHQLENNFHDSKQDLYKGRDKNA